MSLRPIRGFRFEGGLLGTGAGPFDGLTLTPTGTLAMVDDHAAVRQAVLILLTTVPGERVMRPDYGCPLDRLMFVAPDGRDDGSWLVQYPQMQFAPTNHPGRSRRLPFQRRHSHWQSPSAYISRSCLRRVSS